MIAPIFLSASEPNRSRDENYWPGNLLHIREAVRAFCAHVLPHYPLVYGGHPAITPLVDQIAARMNLEARADQERTGNRDQERKSSLPPKILMFRSDLYINPPNAREDVFVTPDERMAVTPAHEEHGERAAPDGGWRNASLLRMRYEMLGRPGPYPVHPYFERMTDRLGGAREHVMKTYEFSGAVFIGGMEGVEHEFNIFRSFHPTTPAYPIASTGSACTDLFERVRPYLTSEQTTGLEDKEAAYSLLMQDLFPIPSAESESVRDRAPWPADPAARNTDSHIDPKHLDGPRPGAPVAPRPMAG
jgi:SLOG cluster3 family